MCIIAEIKHLSLNEVISAWRWFSLYIKDPTPATSLCRDLCYVCQSQRQNLDLPCNWYDIYNDTLRASHLAKCDDNIRLDNWSVNCLVRTDWALTLLLEVRKCFLNKQLATQCIYVMPRLDAKKVDLQAYPILIFFKFCANYRSERAIW